MDRNSRILKIVLSSIASTIFLSCFNDKKNNEEKFINVNWIPKNKNIAGVYILDKVHHEKQTLPRDSILLILNTDSSFVVKNYPYSKSFFGSDTLKFINAKGKWKLYQYKQDNIDYPIGLTLNFTGKYKEYNSIPYTDTINNFTNSKEMYMRVKDSTFSFGFYNGDSDHSKNRFYFRQKKK
ncbi:hypothetical protein [Empedobacter sp.]|uniref:hypothetical protein n=1 Tax=Empedobacter sp. TaxID=1927715 RepID=UPI0028A740B6|nr:hypothetical protein [Empedobacter sp.]